MESNATRQQARDETEKTTGCKITRLSVHGFLIICRSKDVKHVHL